MNPTKDFIVAVNYAYHNGSYNPKDSEQKKKAYLKYGKVADKKLGSETPNGLTGVWWDEIKQFVEPNIIDWSFTKNI